MRIVICMLALAVACKASQKRQTDVGHNSFPSGGYDNAAPQNFFGGGHGGQSHGFSGYGSDNSFEAPSNDFTQAKIQSFAPKTYYGNQEHTAGASHTHDYNFPSLQQLQGHDAQARGFELSGHGDISSADSGNNPDSYIQAVQDLGLHFGGQNTGAQGHSVEVRQEEGHGDENQGGQGGNNHQGFILQDAGGHGVEHNFIGQDEGNDYGYGPVYGHQQDFGHGGDYAIPVGEHTDTETPVPVPQYKHTTYPVPKIIHVNVPKPILVGVPQPYPVKVPVHKPVAVPVETEISIPVEKVVPYPIVKHVPYPVEKHVPYKVEKTVTVHVPQPYPVKIPVYKTIHHHSKH